MELQEAIKLFLEEGGFKCETKRYYKRHLSYFSNFLGDPNVESITRLQITHFHAELSKTKSKLCVYKVLTTVRTFFEFLKENGVAVQVGKFKVDIIPHAHWGYVKAENVERALKLCNDKYKTIILLMWTAGLRVSEVCNLQSEDIDFENGVISVLGKGDKPANVYICERLKKALIKSPPPFNTRPPAVREMFSKVSEKLGIRFHPHALRKSYATDLYRRSNDIYKTSKLLRHSSVLTTQNYAIVEDEELKEFHNKHIAENHEIYCCKKTGGRVEWELKGWVAAGHKVKKIEQAINKAIGDILQG